MIKNLIKWALMTIGLVLSVRAWATFDDTKVEDFVYTTGEQFITALGMKDLEAKYAILDEMFEQKFDTVYMGRFVLGQYYRSLDAEQKEQYLSLFKRYIKSLYKSYPITFDTSDLHFKITKIVPYEKKVETFVTVRLPPKYQQENLQTITIKFNLKPVGESYVISDVFIGDVSLLVSLKPRFADMVKKAEEEPEWFLDDFESLTRSNEYNIQRTKESKSLQKREY